MLKSIKAEFTDFDTAETASRKIRKNLKGIRKIKINSECSADEINENQHFFRLIPTAVTTQNYITIPVSSPYNENRGISHKSFLNIICTEESSAQVHNIMSSMGGINILTETFIP